MYCVGAKGETTGEVHERFLRGMNASDTLDEKPVFEYDEFAPAPTDFSGGQGALVAIATAKTPGVQVEADAPVAVQIIDTGNVHDLQEMLEAVPMPTMLLPPRVWVPLFPTHEEINPKNPEYAPTVEAVLHAFVDHQNTVNESVASALDHAETELKKLEKKRDPEYRAPNLLKRKGLGGAFSCSHAIMVCIADHRPLPPQDKRPLIMLLGGATNKDDAEELITRYVRDGKTPHVIRGIPARTWFSPQLIYLRRMQENDVSVMARKETQGFIESQKQMMVRDEDGKTFLEKSKTVDDYLREAGSPPDGSEAAESEEAAGDVGGADEPAEGESGSA